MMRLSALVLAALLCLTTPVAAQEAANDVATSSVGRIGQRQTRTESPVNAKPMSRVNSRIQNRVTTRIRNRIDRYYRPQDEASAFEAAGDAARTAGQAPR
jgi:hypothetical protein